MKKALMMFVACAICISTVLVYAATKEEAVAMAKKAEQYAAANGKEKMLAEVQKDGGMFEKAEIYLYITNFSGTLLAHPKLPTWVGKSFLSIKDAAGKYFIKEGLEQLKNKNEAWVVYKWNNPITKKIGTKHGYFLKSGDMVIISGVWE